MEHIQIEKGLSAHILETGKFKTNVITVLIRTELNNENATNNAVLAGVMRSGFKRLDSALKIARECESMYGAELEIGVVKKGEEHIIQLYLEALDDRFCGSNYKRAGQLLYGLIFEPFAASNAFKQEYVELQKERQHDIIAGRINDKRKYARERCIEIMCGKERFGVSGDGCNELVDAISPESLFAHYKRLIRESPFEVGIIGGIDSACAKEWSHKHFSRGLEQICFPERAAVLGSHGSLKHANESIGLKQGKLVLGARCGFEPSGADFYKSILFNEILGGGANSKLFKNVREERGLCYYIGSFIYRAKAILLIEAGIDYKDHGEAIELIAGQLELIKKGEISEEELDYAKSSVISQMETRRDSQQSLMDFYMTNALLGDKTEISDMRGIFESVTTGDICDCAKKTRFDTAYCLN